MKLDADQIAGFVETFLLNRFDQPKPIPDFHREMWKACCSDNTKTAFAAPRGFGKSQAITHSMILAMVLFGERDFVLIVSDTETQAVMFLNDLKVELKENTQIINTFGIRKFLRDTETDISVATAHGKFRIIAKGAEQKVRGLKWRGKRPNMVVVDDSENDELVLNKERRRKFSNWFLNALIPCGSDNCLYRVVGTILHADSMLEKLMHDPNWVSKRYQAHDAEYKTLLWPEKFPKERLIDIRSGFASQGNLEGYSQEYLNWPVDEENAFFRKEWFVPMTPVDHQSKKTFYLSTDIAVSTKDRADYTALVVAGVDERNMLCVVDFRMGRWDSLQVIDEMFSLARQYEVQEVFIEKGVIERSLGPVINTEMHSRQQFLNITTEAVTTDKMTRARGIQARMKAGGVRFDIDSLWFPDLQDQLCRFPRAKFDDACDAMSLLGLNVERIYANSEEDDGDDWETRHLRRAGHQSGRSVQTGY